MVDEISMISPNKFLNLKDSSKHEDIIIKEEARNYSPLELHPANLLIFSDSEDHFEDLEIKININKTEKVKVKRSEQNFSNPHSMQMFIEGSDKDEKEIDTIQSKNLLELFISDVDFSKDEMRLFLNSPLPLGKMFQTNLLITDKRFSLFCNSNEKFLINGLKEMKNFSSRYIISDEYDKFDKLEDAFILRSNLVGSVFNFYEEKKEGRVYLASIIYKRNLMRKNKQMEVYIPRITQEKHEFIRKSKKYNLKDDYFTGEVEQLVNMPPEWNEGNYNIKLEFKINIAKTGPRVKLNSVKNFTLINEHKKAVMYFGKTSERTFALDFTYPLSPLQAFAICLTSIETKIFSD